MKMKNPPITLQCNFLLLGEGMRGIGKTALIERYVDKSYETKFKATIVCDIRIKKLEINNKDVNISIIDTPGRERFRSSTKMFIRGIAGFLIGLDLTDEYSLEQVNYWIKQVEENRSKEYPLSWVLFGNKCDDKEYIKVKEEEIKSIQDKYNIKYFETSAKDGTNVNEVFEYLTKLTLKTRGMLNRLGLPDDTPLDGIKIIEKKDQRIEIKRTFKKKKMGLGLIDKIRMSFKESKSEIDTPKKTEKEKEDGENIEFKSLNKYIDF